MLKRLFCKHIWLETNAVYWLGDKRKVQHTCIKFGKGNTNYVELVNQWKLRQYLKGNNFIDGSKE